MKGGDQDEEGREPMRAAASKSEHNDCPNRTQACRDETKKAWFRFEMMRMLCVIFIACMSIFLKEETMPTRPLPSHYTQISTLAVQRKNVTNKSATTLLSVPFYVYESLIWDNLTFGGEKLDELLLRTPLKQSEDFWFVTAALKHPMRVLDAEQAQLYVVPALMNVASDGVILSKREKDPREKGACNGDFCNERLIEQVEVILSESPYYRRSNGSDHVMVLSNWFSSRQAQVVDSPVFRNLNLIQFEDRVLAPNRTTFPSTYVGNPCPMANKTSDFVMVGSLWESAPPRKRQRFKSRRDICSWLQHSTYNTSVCGQGDQCPALAQARYGFHVRGDTWGANRLIDTLLSGTVPIFTNDQQYAILPDWIDWKLLSVQVNVTNSESFAAGLDEILNNTDYEEKLRHILANRDLLDWRTGIAFDVYMFMFQRALLPETLSGTATFNPYNFTALTL